MAEVGYPMLYYFNLSLEVSSHLAPDVIHKKLKSIRDSLMFLNLAQDYWLFFHKTSLRSSFQTRFSISGRDGGLEVFSKILKLGPSHELTLFDCASVEPIFAKAFCAVKECKWSVFETANSGGVKNNLPTWPAAAKNKR